MKKTANARSTSPVGRRTVLKVWANSRILSGFYERFAVDPDDGDVWDEEWELDVAKLRREGALEQPDGVWQVADAANQQRRTLSFSRMRTDVRDKCPRARFVAYFNDADGPVLDGLYDADGNQVYGDKADPSWHTDSSVRDDDFESETAGLIQDMGDIARDHWPDTTPDWASRDINLIDLGGAES
ncbi:hypothetical protein ATK17_1790 [Branchiibius hedensis]|uniref:Uncharacterized protein n=1 Tax=Branchiibius hedensis TaxID=672460 RepID=A0A2Y8ZX68_9MICO|nr:hypothetical protein AZH51_12115 [Branchiibius sp. NY16-3462-2]PWJ25654.1 hypothetical protein ATK17_1790 [Branchiibius hedensis]SSA34467.1 hypothetical protein SAMN04489750_1790 [Branchiibius hedensis]